MSKTLSILICTHNRAEFLWGALESLERQTLPRERFEVVVVDNASTDSTPDMLVRFASRESLDLRWITEPNLGLDAARNRGIRESGGEFVAFLDDDARARHDWVEAILKGFETHPAPILGGRIDLIWGASRPVWFSDVFLPYLIHCDYGPEVVEVISPPWLYGTNVAFRRRIFETIGLFRLDLDRKGDSLMGGGDTEFFKRAHARGEQLLYLPSMVVRHLVPASRLTRSYFRRRLFYSGYTRAAHGREGPGRVSAHCAAFLLGVPLCALTAAGLRAAGNPGWSFIQERRALLGSGYLYYWLRHLAGKVPPPRLEGISARDAVDRPGS